MKRARKATPDHLNPLSQVISDRMHERGLSIRDLALALDVTYEHARRLAKGIGLPSAPILKEIARVTDLDYNQLSRLLVAENITKRYGDIPIELAGKNPEIEPIARVWDQLAEQQKKDAILLITNWASQNRLKQSA